MCNLMLLNQVLAIPIRHLKAAILQMFPVSTVFSSIYKWKILMEIMLDCQQPTYPETPQLPVPMIFLRAYQQKVLH
uniref:Uncharacterized protein n=1 Tax=Arundo donax TaxID=35708 RepID=A0A0A9D695_ARUDO